jgi:hypothetical protein
MLNSIPQPIVDRYARKLFHIAHPQSDWKLHPNTQQAKIQERFIREARVLLFSILTDIRVLELVVAPLGISAKECLAEEQMHD